MGNWVTAFAAAGREMREGVCYAGRTVRLRVRVNLAGDTLRLRFANLFGDKPVQLGPITLWNGRGTAEVTFDGQPAVRMAKGCAVMSDAVFLPVRPGDTLTVLIYFPSALYPPLTASGVYPVERSPEGDFTSDPDFAADLAPLVVGDNIQIPWALPALENIELFAGEDAGVVAALGDSITEMGYWTGPLGEALEAENPGKLAFVNLGISGNRLLYPTSGKMAEFSGNCFGESGLARFERDILSIKGLKAVYIAMGVNDITQPGSNDFAPPLSERCRLEELAAGFSRLQHALTDRGVKVVGCTVTPFGGMGGFCPETLKLWDGFNGWLRRQAAAGEIGLADFGRVIEDPARPGYMRPAYDSGDHLHPCPAGGKVMAEEAERALQL